MEAASCFFLADNADFPLSVPSLLAETINKVENAGITNRLRRPRR
jgi:hypothetical protein